MAAPPEDPSGWGDKADTSVGDFEDAFASAPITIDATYTTPDQHPAMMEPQATTAVWDGDRLTIYTSNQMANWVASAVASMVGVPRENVRAVCAFVGGGFGSKLRTYADATLSAFAARDLKRPVKTALARDQLLNHTIRRGGTIQRIRLAATPGWPSDGDRARELDQRLSRTVPPMRRRASRRAWSMRRPIA